MNNKAAMLGLAVLAFLVAAVLVIMIFRMLFGGRLRMPGGRSRQARLGIVDAFDLDRQRQLIIVRRDNVEHLIMIGGPNDLVVEAEIIRAESRDARREPGLVPGYADGSRIPAPMPAIDKPEPGSAADLPQAADQPPLPLPLPASGPPPEPASAPRGPTFPLPRRQAQAERSPPAPPRLPEGVSRGDYVASQPSQPPGQAPAPHKPVQPPPAARPPSPRPPPVSPPQAASPAPASPTASPPAGPAAAPPPPRPPVLKSPPPRPPFRPLQRATPQQPSTTPPSGAPQTAAPAVGGPAAAPRPSSGAALSGPPVTRPSQPQQSASGSPKPAGSDEALESLEEEMAKLLGRGS